jgi:hypothetical protein
MINKNYIGKNFHGKHLIKLVSVDGHQEPFINLNDAFVTMTVSFTAESVRLVPDKIIPDILVQKSKKSDTHFGIKELGPGSYIRVVFNIGYNDVLNGAFFPTRLREITHNPHSRDITAIGEILVPYTNVTFYKHDGSTNATGTPVKPLQINDETSAVYDKIKQFYLTPDLKDLQAMSSFSSSAVSATSDKIYVLQGPLGPIMEVTPNSTVAGVKWEDMNPNIVNMYDIENNAIDASNAIKVISGMYLDPENKKKIQPYISFVNVKRKRAAVVGAQQPANRR